MHALVMSHIHAMHDACDSSRRPAMLIIDQCNAVGLSK